MKINKWISVSQFLSLPFLCLMISCASGPNIQLPDPMPGYIREYKSFRVYGNRHKVDTGINLNEGDFYSIIATGQINLGKRKVGPHTGVFLQYIDKTYLGSVFYSGTISILFEATTAGRLYLGIADSYPDDNFGFFNVVVIVWEKNNYEQIGEFYGKLSANNPENTLIRDAYNEAVRLKRIYIAKEKTTKELKEIRKEILQLQQESVKTGDQIQDFTDHKRIQELEAKLLELTSTLDKLEEMEEELVLAKQRTKQLSWQLEEKEKREKELLNKIADGAKNPPILLIASPTDGMKTESKTVRLVGAAEDEQGLKQLTIFVNNRLLGEDKIRGIRLTEGAYPRRFDLNRRIHLKKGENRIKIQVIDIDGLFSEKTLTVHHIEKRHNVWAVLIGINDYQHVRRLKYAVNDARAFYDLLVEYNQIPRENVILLINQNASLRQMRSTLGTLLKNKAGTNDLVIIYFAGHGATERDMMSPDGDGLEKYLLPFDADPADLYSSALPMREIAHIFHRIRSERLVFIADACYSGASGGRTVSTLGLRANISNSFLERIAGGKGKIIMTASSANEVSMENDELGHGIFTYYMIEGLKGKADIDRDGLITVDEAYRYVTEKVTYATGQEQHPVKKGAVEGQLVLGIVQ